ncbi:MAG TPA: hypothetical protein VFM68_02655 [Candidatus Saccharimonadales bacterium]|nr:hypothetical protein [Candidatus Saccharimonadales bacterium]
MIHHIQRTILDALATSHSLRFGELKPNDLDGNIFTYHLKQLVTDKYVAKQNDGSYTLLPRGKEYIVHRYENPLLQAHSIFLTAVRRGDEWLMRERLVQPLIGMAGFIHGEPIAGEPVLQTATRRLKEKTGLDIPLSYHSSGLICISKDNTIESYSHALLLTGTTEQGMLITNDATGRNFWSSDLDASDVLPSCRDLATKIITDDMTPFDLAYY